MSNPVAIRPPAQITEQEFTKEQLTLIKATVAKNATNDELSLFLYRCKNMGLDPLKPGQVHFIKYGSSPGTIVVGIDGFRSRADRTGNYAGISRGVTRDDKGKCIGAWCEVYRKDWSHPAKAEVSLAEYTTGKAMWAKMPETMIQKVAEVAALRMAFPNELGGFYAEEELGRSGHSDLRAKEITAKLEAEEYEHEVEVEALPIEPVGQELAADYIIKVGKNKGKQIKDLTEKQITAFLGWFNEKIGAGEKMHNDVVEYAKNLELFRESAAEEVP